MGSPLPPHTYGPLGPWGWGSRGMHFFIFFKKVMFRKIIYDLWLFIIFRSCFILYFLFKLLFFFVIYWFICIFIFFCRKMVSKKIFSNHSRPKTTKIKGRLSKNTVEWTKHELIITNLSSASNGKKTISYWRKSKEVKLKKKVWYGKDRKGEQQM